MIFMAAWGQQGRAGPYQRPRPHGSAGIGTRGWSAARWAVRPNLPVMAASVDDDQKSCGSLRSHHYGSRGPAQEPRLLSSQRDDPWPRGPRLDWRIDGLLDPCPVRDHSSGGCCGDAAFAGNYSDSDLTVGPISSATAVAARLTLRRASCASGGQSCQERDQELTDRSP